MKKLPWTFKITKKTHFIIFLFQLNSGDLKQIPFKNMFDSIKKYFFISNNCEQYLCTIKIYTSTKSFYLQKQLNWFQFSTSVDFTQALKKYDTSFNLYKTNNIKAFSFIFSKL